MFDIKVLPTLFKSLIGLLPTSCVVCGRDSQNCYNLCHVCEAELPWIQRSCPVCGIDRIGQSQLVDTCGSCLLNPPPFTSCNGIFHYVSPIDKLLTDFKFNARFEVGFALSNILSKYMQRYYLNSKKPDLILPVPLHRNRLRLRGFNQAIEIAKVVSRLCHIPLSKSAIMKIRDTSPQTEIGTARARKLNLRGAFSVANPAILKNVKSVALIDDVVTTMATVTALSKVLQSHGISRIDVWCLARANR